MIEYYLLFWLLFQMKILPMHPNKLITDPLLQLTPPCTIWAQLQVTKGYSLVVVHVESRFISRHLVVSKWLLTPNVNDVGLSHLSPFNNVSWTTSKSNFLRECPRTLLTQFEKLLGKSFSFKTNLGNDSNMFNATPHNDTFDNFCVNHCNDLPIKKNNFLFEHQPLNILCGFTIYVMLMKGYVFKFKGHYLHNHGDLKSYWKTPTYQTSQTSC